MVDWLGLIITLSVLSVCDGQMLPPPSIVGGDYSSQYLYVGVFADHGVSDIDRFLLYITPEEDASVTVEHPEGTPFTYAGTAGATEVFSSIVASISSTGTFTSAAFAVYSTSRLTVTAVASGEYTGIDTANILQMRREGFNKYVIPSYQEGLYFTIISTTDRTNVTVHTADDLKEACYDGSSTDYELDYLETQTLAEMPGLVGRSICVYSDAPVAVIMTSGSVYVPYQGPTQEPWIYGSNLFEQLVPVDFLSNSYVLPNLSERPAGGHPEMYTVMSAKESGINTVTIESGVTSAYATSRKRTLKYGQYLDFDVDPGLSVKVSCSGACSVLGLHHRQGQDGVETGPFMFLVPPMKMQQTIILHDELYSEMDILIRPEMTIIREAGETVTSDQGYITGFSPLGIDSSLEVTNVQIWDNNIQTVTASGRISAIAHGHNSTFAVGTSASVNTGVDYCSLEGSCSLGEICYNPCYDEETEDCADIADGFACMSEPDPAAYDIKGYIVAPAEIRVWLDGKTADQRKSFPWAEAGDGFYMTWATSFFAMRLLNFRDPRVKNNNMMFMVAFEFGRLRSGGIDNIWNWKCAFGTSAESGWKEPDFDISTSSLNWETPQTEHPHINDGSNYPYFTKIKNVDPVAEYVWISTQGVSGNLYCRATPNIDV